MKNTNLENDTCQHIKDCGYQLMMSKGFSSVGLAEILKNAGVPKGSFYHYFKSKEHFAEEVINNYFTNYLAILDRSFSDSTTTGYAAVIAYWQLWVNTQGTHCAGNKCLVVKLSAEVADLSEAMRVALRDGSAQVKGRIAQCIQRGIDDQSIEVVDANVSAELLYNLWLGASLMAKLHRNSDALTLAMQQTQSLLKGKSL